MKLKNFTKKKVVAFGLAFGVAAGAGGIAAAFFASSGTGAGTAQSGNATAVKITQVGAGYNSLIASTGNTYTASECFKACLNNQQIGDKVSLGHLTPKWAATTYAQVTSVIVPLVNFGGQKTLTVVLNMGTSPNVTSYRFTTSATIAAGSATNQVVTNVKFTLSNTHVFLYKTFIYGIELTGTTSGVNIALAHHATELTIGGSPANTVYIQKVGGTFAATVRTTGYLPAVQINVIGGVVPPLYPGAPAQPVQYAITNPNPGKVHVGSITTAITKSGTTVTGATGCKAYWFTLTNNPFPYNTNVAPGTTIVTSSSPTTLALLTKPFNQSECASKSIPLTFSSN